MKYYFLSANYRFKRRKIWRNGQTGFDPEYQVITLEVGYESFKKQKVQNYLNELFSNSSYMEEILMEHLPVITDDAPSNKWQLISSWLSVESGTTDTSKDFIDDKLPFRTVSRIEAALIRGKKINL